MIELCTWCQKWPLLRGPFILERDETLGHILSSCPSKNGLCIRIASYSYWQKQSWEPLESPCQRVYRVQGELLDKE